MHAAADCSMCKGSGSIIMRRWDPGSAGGGGSRRGAAPVLAVPQACPACRGSGKAEAQDCAR
jgi:DnaJ-class molecular chaperone